jgi:hypothetical protein
VTLYDVGRNEGASMKKLSLVLATLVVLGGAAFLSGVSAQGELPEHAHLLVLGFEVEEGFVVDFRKCVELAAGQALPLKTQHAHVHFGTANLMLQTRAGNAVVPTAPFPFVPWDDCAGLRAALPLPVH